MFRKIVVSLLSMWFVLCFFVANPDISRMKSLEDRIGRIEQQLFNPKEIHRNQPTISIESPPENIGSTPIISLVDEWTMLTAGMAGYVLPTWIGVKRHH